MAPPAAAATAAPARRLAGDRDPARRRGRSEPRRAPLRVVPGRSRRAAGTAAPARRRRLLPVISVSMVVASLLAVVVAHAFLANGQVRLSALQHDLAMEQGVHRQADLTVAMLETPARIVAAASTEGMTRPPSVTQLPYVSLSVPLPTPKVTPAPVTAPAAGTTTSSSTAITASGTSGTTPSSTTVTSTP